jgi:Reverse transcriptase (RNA-dependent DNA polymerase)
MHEKLAALEKNKIWDLKPLPQDKKTIGYKWVFSTKHTPEEKVERCKARLVIKKYSQT